MILPADTRREKQLGSAKALRQKHAWYDQRKSQEVTEAGMEKAVRKSCGE